MEGNLKKWTNYWSGEIREQELEVERMKEMKGGSL